MYVFDVDSHDVRSAFVFVKKKDLEILKGFLMG
jgi:hypothetical protein